MYCHVCHLTKINQDPSPSMHLINKDYLAASACLQSAALLISIKFLEHLVQQ